MEIRKKKKKPEPRPEHNCAVTGCNEPAPYKAPKSRTHLREYQWFCLDHIREFNKGWDFFDGMNTEQIEKYVYDAIIGHRPTWEREGHWHRNKGADYTSRLKDAFAHFFAWEAQENKGKRLAENYRERKAYKVLELEEACTKNELKAQYRMLVKRYHPDMHQGSNEHEEKFKQVTAAYAYLLTIFEESEKHEH